MPMPNRIRIMGSPGSGKTTIGRAIASATGLPLLSLDRIRHSIPSSLSPEEQEEKRRANLEAFLSENDRWVIEGNQLDWARDTVEKANHGIIISRPVHVRAWRMYQRWRAERKTAPQITLRRHLGLQSYGALWDSRWLPPLIQVCDDYELRWDYCRTDKDVERVLAQFPGALEHYRQATAGGAQSYRTLSGVGITAELTRFSQEAFLCFDDLLLVVSKV